MIIAPLGETKPHAGVMTTNPATMPEQKPRMDGLPLLIHSTNAQTKPAVAVARVVVMKELVEMPSAARAEPALKPYQPTQSIPVPTIQSTIECGAIFSLPKPRRFPRIKQSTNALQPEVICTTVPPAKSIALMAAFAFQMPFIIPSIPHTAVSYTHLRAHETPEQIV